MAKDKFTKADGQKAATIAKRASKIYKARKKSHSAELKAAMKKGDKAKMKALGAEYRKNFGGTPSKRWAKALRDARKADEKGQMKLFR